MHQDPPSHDADRQQALAAGFRIGEWHVLPAEGVLRSGAKERHLAPRPMAILELLGNHGGTVVSKENIFQSVWQGTAVEDGALPRCVSEIRSVLGDDARHPRYIRTIPKKGYQLIAPVERASVETALESAPIETALESASVETAPVEAVVEETGIAKTTPAAQRAPWWLVTLALGIMLALGAWMIRERIDRQPTVSYDLQRTIAVLGIDDLSDHSENDWLSTALAEMLTTELAISDRLRTTPEDTVALMKGQLSIAAVSDGQPLGRLRRHLGVDLGVVGTYLVAPKSHPQSIRLDLQILANEPPEIQGAVVVTGNVDELADLVLLAGLRLREALGVGAQLANESRLAGTPGPGDPTTARYYYQGLHALRRLDTREAVDLLDRARQADPANPYVHSALARAWSTLGYDAHAKTSAIAALEFSAGLPREQRLWTEARSHAVNGEWGQAIDRLQALWLVTADNLEYGHELARAQLDAGRPRDAMVTLTDLSQRTGDTAQDPRIALAVSEAVLKLGEPRRALEAADESLALARELGATRVGAKALAWRALSLQSLGRSEEAEAALEEATGIFVEAGDRSSEARTQVTHAAWLENRGEAARAEALERSALAIFTSIGDRAGEALTLRRLAGHVWKQRGAEEARAMFERAITICREIGNPAGEADALNALAVNTAIHDAGPTAPLFEQALDLYRKIGNKQRMSSLLINLGRSSFRDGDLGPAIQRFSEAEAVFRELSVPKGVAWALFNIAHTMNLTGDVKGATASFQEAVEIYRETQNPRMLAASLEGLGDIRLQAGNAAEARRHLAEGLELQTTQGDARGIASSRAALARALMVLGDLGGAEQQARRGLASAEASESLPAQRAARVRLAEILLESGHSAAARAALDELLAQQQPVADLTVAQRQVTVARVLARTGDHPQALEMLDQVAELATEKGARRLRLEAELARLDLVESAARDREWRPALEAIHRQAEDRGLRWIAHRAHKLIGES